MAGFATASGKTVHVSEAALRRAKQLFDEVGSDEVALREFTQPDEMAGEGTTNAQNSNRPEKRKVGTGTLTEETNEKAGFATASGKTVHVSEAALRKAKQLFDDEGKGEVAPKKFKSAPSENGKDAEPILENICMETQPKNNTIRTLSQEILESTAAFLADESENSCAFLTSRLIEPVTSQPSAPEDRSIASEHIIIFPEECSPIVPPGSPILGEQSKGSQRKIRRKSGRRRNLSMSSSVKSSTPLLMRKECALNISLPVRNEDDLRKAWEDDEDDEMLTKLEIDDIIPEVILRKEEEELLGTGRELRPEVSEGRKRAAEEQEKLVKAGITGKNGPKMAKGSLFAKKTSSPNIRRSWKSFVGSETPGHADKDELRRLGVGQWIWDVTSENAADFRFDAWTYYSADMCRENVFGLPVGDGARLILNDEGVVGVAEVERAFLASPSVDPALVPSGWVRNHYRWIIWKLASLERRFPKHFAGVLTPHSVMQQLKYRYDREIDRCQRPALRKILEHDDTPALRMITCIASVRKIDGEAGTSQVELELTDGWYSVFALIDNELQSRVLKGKVTPGSKIMTHGAELINSPQGCPPLEISADVRLKITSNSSRRVRWDAKLGFQRNPTPFKIPLQSILANGGMVGCVTVYIARIYPLIYLEKGKARTVVRSERAERREAAMAETNRQKAAEQLYIQAQAEVQHDQSNRTKAKRHCTPELLAKVSSEELCSLMESAIDPVAFENMLSEEQKRLLLDRQRERQESLCREVELKVKQRLEEKPQHKVTPVLKIRLVDGKNPDSDCSATLSIWNPPEEMSTLFKETQLTTMYSLIVNGWRAGVLQLSATRSTQYQPQQEREVRMPSHIARTLTVFSDLYTKTFSPTFGEVDIVGVVVRVDPPPQESASNNNETPRRKGFQCQSVYLADDQQNIVGVSFVGGLREFGVDDLVNVGVVLSMTNLQWRGGALKCPISLYAQDVSVFSVNPCQQKLRDAIQALQKIIKPDVKSFVKSCKDKIKM